MNPVHQPHQRPDDSGEHLQVDNLTDQMAATSLRPTSQSGHGSYKKRRDRHAYHDIVPAGSSQAFNGVPQNAVNPSDFLSQQAGPTADQFPLPVNPAFAPEQPASQLQFAARSGMGPSSSFIPSSGQLGINQLPSVAAARYEASKLYSQQVYPTMERRLPPPAAVPFTAFDQGNSSPKFIRLTMNSIPPSGEDLAATGLPLGLIVQPLAPLDGEEPIPVVDFGDNGPPRCQRCRTYINPFMVFRSGGNKYVCNMCGFANDVLPDYFAPADMAGIRNDRDARPELMKGTIEFAVPKEYAVEESVPIQWLILLDTSENSVKRGFLAALCDGIRRALYLDPDQSGEIVCGLPAGSKIGIVTFDSEAHFYDLSPAQGERRITMLVMSDMQDPFVPLDQGLLVDPIESQAEILALLDELPRLFASGSSAESAPLSTVKAAMQAFGSHGGKIVCSLAELPTLGLGRLVLRSQDGSSTVMPAEDPDWVDFAQTMAEAGVGVDFFLAAPNNVFLDTATVGYLSSKTGGDMYYYNNFHADKDASRVGSDLAHTLSRQTGVRALMKVRCSNGLQVDEYQGNFLLSSPGSDMQFGVIDEDKTVSVLFSYDSKLDPRMDVYFQSALLYTTADGHRRVRCCNVVANIAKSPFEPMKFLDEDAILTLIAKQAASRVANTPLKTIRESIQDKTIEVLAKYRKTLSESPAQGQLVLPEMLKVFCMYMLGLSKTVAFKGGSVPSDLRVHELRVLKAMSAREVCLYIYPRVYSLHDLDPKDGFLNELGQLQMPEPRRASFSKVDEGGVYIVDNGQVCLLWIHSRVSPVLLQDLFGEECDDIHKINPLNSDLPVLETLLNTQTRNIIQFLSTTRGARSLVLQIARAGIDGAEYEYARLLYEDRNNEAQSYVDWLMHIHRQISLELSGNRAHSDANRTVFGGFRSFWA